MSATVPVIRYFACRGRVEPLRLMFTEACITWKEDPLSDPAGWATEKAKTPFGSLPIVTEGDKKYTQTMAIIRHYANKHNFFGNDSEERFRADIMVEAVLDAQEKLAAKYYWNPNWETDKKDVEEKLLPPIYKNLENFFKKRTKGHGPFTPDAMPHYKDLEKFYKDFSSREKVSEYLHSDKRFKTHTISMSPVGGTPETSAQP